VHNIYSYFYYPKIMPFGPQLHAI